MDVSVFGLVSSIDYRKPLFNVQKKWEGYKGLNTTKEQAILFNSGDTGSGKIWADLESTHLYDGKNVKITCVFGGEWAQRIEVLGEKEHGTRELTFSGIINGDLSQGNLPVLEDCKLY